MEARKKAFSPIELLVIIAIIVLVPSILIASLQTARDLAKVSICANQLRQIGEAMYEFAQINDGNLPNTMPFGVTDPTDEDYHPYAAYRGDRPEFYQYPDGNLVPLRLACLHEAGLVEDARLFYCPANMDPWFRFESYNNPPPWGKLPQVYNEVHQMNQWVRTGYAYFPVDPNGPMSVFTGAPRYVARKFDDIDPNLPYLTDIIRTIYTISHNVQGQVGINGLYKDGSVVFCAEREVFEDKTFPSGTQFAGMNLWVPDSVGRTRSEINAIYYYRMVALGDPNDSRINN